ncbi:MAG: ASCH domain-containing protein [Hyphomicrobiaceae bacterium]|nr:MAG: ASCH domain-containing protein [Hyphomicrobiaceae bacterium]
MQAITVHQPYAHLIATGEKLVENRKWYTKHRGWLAIHAGVTRERLELDEGGLVDASGVPVEEMAFGAVVCVANMVDCVRSTDIQSGRLDVKYPELKGHVHVEGPWCWVLQDVRRLKVPYQCKGRQGFWTWYVHGHQAVVEVYSELFPEEWPPEKLAMARESFE